MPRFSAIAIPIALVAVLGCASAYDKTYNEELGRLEAEERARQQAAEAARAEARAEASRYVAVVYFKVGSAMIHEDGYHELQWFVDKMRPYPGLDIDVKGYADSTGSEPRNQQLSLERAKNVADFLVQQGIPLQLIAPAGYASNFPDEPNDTAKGRSRNRRVEVRVTYNEASDQ